jgi:hypothetical protein
MKLRMFMSCLLGAALAVPALHAETRISLGYGLQLNSLLNKTLNTNMQRAILNADGKALYGSSGTQNYNSIWSATADDSSFTYPLVNLPELRLESELTGSKAKWGVYGAISGIVPQTSGYYLGNFELKEGKKCAGVDYLNCPLASENFVTSGSAANYEMEVRTNLRFYNIAGGVTLATNGSKALGGLISFGAELGLTLQSFSSSTQFVGTRCTSGGSAPCASNSQVRVLQGELKSQSVFALGPTLGLRVRYDRPTSWWFADLAVTTTVLFMQLENTGYTNFVAAGTVAFSQKAGDMGIDAVQNQFAILPAVSVRFGVRIW